MAKENNKKDSQNSIVHWFCGTLLSVLAILIAYQCYSTQVLTNSQNRIIQEHINHIANVDSLFFEMKEIILSADSGTISNTPELLSQLQKDSALFRREILLSQEEASSLTELHLNTLNNYFTQIGVWFGVASVIFLVFGFFGIFKIEEAKAEAKRALKEVEEKGNTATSEINNLQSQASNLNATITTIRQDNANFIADRTKDVNELIESINKTQANSETYFNHAKELVQSLETKNKEYDWSVETMEKQLELLDNLLNKLKDFMENNGKEESDE